MKLKFKKYIYLLNDITNQILKKDREDLEAKTKKMKHWVVGLSIALLFLVIVTAILLLPYIINLLNK